MATHLPPAAYGEDMWIAIPSKPKVGRQRTETGVVPQGLRQWVVLFSGNVAGRPRKSWLSNYRPPLSAYCVLYKNMPSKIQGKEKDSLIMYEGLWGARRFLHMSSLHPHNNPVMMVPSSFYRWSNWSFQRRWLVQNHPVNNGENIWIWVCPTVGPYKENRPTTETEFATVEGHDGLETVWFQIGLQVAEPFQSQRVYNSKIGFTGKRKDPCDWNC